MIRARILSIGDELLLGRVIDSNAAWIAQWCWAQGLSVAGVEQVGDGLEAIIAAMRRGAEASDVLIVSGGLGPTDDDRTRHALAGLLGVELCADAAQWTRLQAWWQRRFSAAAPESNRRQTLRPRGAAWLANALGTAPGLRVRHGKTLIACFPGVPREMIAMLPSLARHLPPRRVPTVGECWLAGIGESSVQQRLPDVLREAEPMVGITANEAGHLVLRAVGTAAQVRTTLRTVRAALPEFLLPQPGLAASVVEALRQRRWRIAAAESCSGGRIAAALTAVPGASQVFGASFVTYSDAAKRALGVDALMLATHGAVSRAVAEALARAALLRGDAHLAVAVTGLAGPSGGTPEQPVGTVWIAIALRHSEQCHAECLHFHGDRHAIQQRACASALLRVWQALAPKEKALAPRKKALAP